MGSPLFAVIMSLSSILSVVVLPLAVYASCGHRTSHVEGFTFPKFDYNTVNGPLNWHNLDPAYYLCGNGTAQAPTIVSSNGTATVPASDFVFNIPKMKNVTFENLGTTVEVVMTGTMSNANVTYNLKQFHFHTPSEHRLDGEQYSMEMHMVFQSVTNATAVVGFLIDLAASTTTPILDDVGDAVSYIPNAGDEVYLDSVDFAPFIAKYVEGGTFYAMMESLTTPPCSENISWFLFSKPIELSVDKYKAIKKVTKFNSRYTQDTLGQQDILEIAAQGLVPAPAYSTAAATSAVAAAVTAIMPATSSAA